MTTQTRQACLIRDAVEGAIAGLTDAEMPFPQSFKESLKATAQDTLAFAEWVQRNAYTTVKAATEAIGKTLDPIARHPAIQTVSKVPGLNWLLLWLGQVDVSKAQAEVDQLRLNHPTDTDAQIAQRVIDDMALQAGRIGFLTNIVPPVALALLAVDLVAVTKLQAEMVYRIAAAYRFDLNDPVRRGEVIAIYGLSFGTGTPIKAGLSFVELIPGFGTVVGVVSDAALVYIPGLVARQFYETKRSTQAQDLSLQDAL